MLCDPEGDDRQGRLVWPRAAALLIPVSYRSWLISNRFRQAPHSYECVCVGKDPSGRTRLRFISVIGTFRSSALHTGQNRMSGCGPGTLAMR